MADNDDDGRERIGMLSKVMAGCIALAAFAVAIVAGLAAENSAGLVLGRALMAMIFCYPVGFIIGMVCDHVINLHMQHVQQAVHVDEPSSEVQKSDLDDEDPITV